MGFCVFCENHTILTKEDVLPKWVARELRRPHPHAYVGMTVVHITEAGAKNRWSKKGSVAALKMPRLCNPCNNVLGGIEKAAGRVLNPRWAVPASF